jgi:hypothetical protein
MDFLLLGTCKKTEIDLLLKRYDNSDISEWIVEGKHLEFLQNNEFDIPKLLNLCHEKENFYESCVEYFVSWIDNSDSANVTIRFEQLYLTGIALLELFNQANYTGPEFTSIDRTFLQADLFPSTDYMHILECDGNYPFSLIDMPHLLILARIILRFVYKPLYRSWKTGVQIDENGILSIQEFHDGQEISVFANLKFLSNSFTIFPSASWWNTRATVIHGRLLQGINFENCPTLWIETLNGFVDSLQLFCGLDNQVTIDDLPKLDILSMSLQPASLPPSFATSVESTVLASSLLLETGLAFHYFGYGDKVSIRMYWHARTKI